MNQFLFNAKREMTGERLWKKFEDWRMILCTQYFSKLPKNLSDIPSGHQLMDVYKKFVLDRFREENVSFEYVFVLFSIYSLPVFFP